MKKIIMICLLLVSWQIQAEFSFKHGVYLSKSIGNIKADISGMHQDFAAYLPDNQVITEENASIYKGRVSSYNSFGYNLRYMPEVGWGFEFGAYATKIKIPTQRAALIHDNGVAFRKNTASGAVDEVVDSPSSYINNTDLYIGALYNFPKTNRNYIPYIGAGYANTKGNWYNSYYSGTPDDNTRYGTEGKTAIEGNYASLKAGVNFKEHYGMELETSVHKFYADSFRGFNINGSNSKFNRTTLNFMYRF